MKISRKYIKIFFISALLACPVAESNDDLFKEMFSLKYENEIAFQFEYVSREIEFRATLEQITIKNEQQELEPSALLLASEKTIRCVLRNRSDSIEIASSFRRSDVLDAVGTVQKISNSFLTLVDCDLKLFKKETSRTILQPSIVYRVRSPAMRPKYNFGDILKYSTHLDVIDTGAVVVYRFPKDLSLNYLHRIIGKPGDLVTYKNKKIVLNGIPVKRINTKPFFDENILAEFDQWIETINGKKYYVVNDQRSSPNVPSPDNFPSRELCTYDDLGFECRVPSDEYFVMGDNRDNILDSRYWGFVPKKKYFRNH